MESVVRMQTSAPASISSYLLATYSADDQRVSVVSGRTSAIGRW
jgi:hypothetical protein